MAFFDFDAEDQKQIRENRRLTPGKHKANLIGAKCDVTGGGKDCIILDFRTDTDAKSAPDGQVDLRQYVMRGNSSLTNFLDIFAPNLRGQSGRIDDDALQAIIGDPVVLLTKMSKPVFEPDGKTVKYESKPEIGLILKPLKDQKKAKVETDALGQTTVSFA